MIMYIFVPRQLLEDDRVLFAGYHIRHPLEKDIFVKVQTKRETYARALFTAVAHAMFLLFIARNASVAAGGLAHACLCSSTQYTLPSPCSASCCFGEHACVNVCLRLRTPSTALLEAIDALKASFKTIETSFREAVVRVQAQDADYDVY